MTTPSERRDTVQFLVRRGISQRKALGYLGLSRRIASYAPRQAAKDEAVAQRLLAASPEVPRFGYRRMAAWLALGEARVRRARALVRELSVERLAELGKPHNLTAKQALKMMLAAADSRPADVIASLSKEAA